MSRQRELIDRWWHMFEGGSLDDLSELMAPNAEVVMPGGMVMRGPGELRPMLEGYFQAFPDLHHEVVSTVEADDAIVVELRITMTHTGTFVTPMGDLPPTGNSVVLEACDVARFGSDGRIASWHTYFDAASFMAQLNVAAV